MPEPTVRYDVMAVIDGRPQPRKSFGGPEAAAQEIAKLHKQGHIARCMTNALVPSVEATRLSKLADRVNEILAAGEFPGTPWGPGEQG